MTETIIKPRKDQIAALDGENLNLEVPPNNSPLSSSSHFTQEAEKNTSSQDWSNNISATTLTFKNLSYKVQVKNPGKTGPKMVDREILRDISGICKPGELTAIMGSSGAGKTTLLNILSCRITPDGKTSKLNGEILANGNAYNFREFSKFAGYVMQNDILLETMTPREVLLFTAELRIKGESAGKIQKVNELIHDLRLEKCADTLIGGKILKGISGGERKRTAIGVELMTDPNLLFLDEPTSGLDSFTAFVLLSLLKTLANKGKTIIFTIHQPSSDIFFLFDRLMILTRGKFLYQGPANDAVKYFGNIGYKCPEYSNPADYFIQVAHVGKNDTDENFRPMFDAFDQTLALEVQNEIAEFKKKPLIFSEKQNGFFYSTKQIAKRSAINFYRNPVNINTRITNTIFFCFIICSLYFQLSKDPENPLAQSNINGAFFFTLVCQFFSTAMVIVLTFPVERAVFLKEYSQNIYSVSSYYFGKQIVELPITVLFCLIMCLILYYICGFNNDAGKLFIFALINIGQALAGNSIGLLAGTAFSDVKVALAIVPMTILPMMLFGGFYINSNNMPAWLGWIQWISPFRYAMEALMWNEYEDSSFGTAIMGDYGFDVGLWGSIATLFAIGLAIRLLGLFALKKLARKLE